jgi:cysteinyl-tRNA synthetase
VSQAIDYRAEMRRFVAEIAAYARKFNPNFAIVPQNGIELITNTGYPNGIIDQAYMNTINAVGQEDLFYGGSNEDSKLSSESSKWVVSFLNKTRAAGKLVMVSDYCKTTSKRLDSYSMNSKLGFISQSITNRYDSVVPPDAPFNQNANNIAKLTDAKNFLYFINPVGHTKASMATLMQSLNYDILLIDPIIENNQFYTKADTDKLRKKKKGGRRMILCYMSIGEAEVYRYYWNKSWKFYSGFLDKENPEWSGNIKVMYWMPEWKKLVYGDNSMTKKLIDAGCDGAYLDIIDAFQHFEGTDKC